MLLTVLKQWLRGSRRAHAGIQFKEFKSVTAKLRHAFTAIPAGKGLLSPCNWVLRARPEAVFLHRNKGLEQAIRDARTLLRETRAEMAAAILRGPHESALTPEALAHFKNKVAEKVESGQEHVVEWDAIKDNPPAQLKILPIPAIPHKSKPFRSILDLSFRLRLENGGVLMAVNDTSTKTAPQGAIDQIGHALKRIIHAFAGAGEDEKIFMAKWDIKDGFWRLQCREGEEWNFAYVLPQELGLPIKLVVPTSLQMGWIESPPYFCAASETARDVAAQYIETAEGSLCPQGIGARGALS